MDLKLEQEVIKDFIIKLNTTYPQLLYVDGKSIYCEIESDLHKKSFNEREILNIQSEVYDILESYENIYPDWYSIYHSLYISTIRRSKYATKKLSNLLSELMRNAGITQCEKLLVPASGKFFEVNTILKEMKPNLIIAEEINYSAIEYSRAMFGTCEKLVLRQADLTQKQADSTIYDGILLLHPQVTDYDKLSNSPLYKKYYTEFRIPYPEITSQPKLNYFDDDWKKIIHNSFSRLKTGGHAFFVFYEYRELDITLAWLETLNNYKIIHYQTNDGLIDFSFAKDFSRAIESDAEDTAKYVVMGAYRTGLVIQKI